MLLWPYKKKVTSSYSWPLFLFELALFRFGAHGIPSLILAKKAFFSCQLRSSKTVLLWDFFPTKSSMHELFRKVHISEPNVHNSDIGFLCFRTGGSYFLCKDRCIVILLIKRWHILDRLCVFLRHHKNWLKEVFLSIL